MKLSPRSEALAYRIWGHCTPIGWNCTMREVAEALEEDRSRISSIANKKGWSDRFRRSGRHMHFRGDDPPTTTHGMLLRIDEELENLGGDV
ncbi:hypothetical protein [Pelagovum pacificum]|uniref:Uncharacterized protein n=1 Tax=Pelagovum pacificum TaxID=2588711 RepID=A0A5C5GDT1_9RHOB|nr:hypothetical protein [Pelagovum pacificum]QQA43939.1 hypothetical protein I8N54_05005 [Pelagovum pacificum]TNY32932.1 hypothetical protein FHY64_06545 [Pelagovum pacificum]